MMTRAGAMGAAAIAAVAIVAACQVDVVGTDDGVGGSGAGPATAVTQAHASGQGPNTVAVSTGGAQGCGELALDDCLVAPNCVPLMRNDVILPDTPPAPPGVTPLEPGANECCWGCEKPDCTSCHQPIFTHCIGKQFCNGLPSQVCGYVPSSACD